MRDESISLYHKMFAAYGLPKYFAGYSGRRFVIILYNSRDKLKLNSKNQGITLKVRG